MLNATIRRFGGHGFEHVEESCWRAGPTDIGFHSETYGDADSIEIDLSRLANARFVIEGTIDSYVKVGDPKKRNPYVHAPEFRWEVSGAELIVAGELRLELGGTELFIALERLTERTLPVDLAGRLTVEPGNAPFGWRPVYLTGRQRDDAKVWSSALFIEFS